MAKTDKQIMCVRCQIPKKFVGTYNFHEGRRWGILGDLGEIFVDKVSFDLYGCRRCGSVEFFVDGIGEELREEDGPP